MCIVASHYILYSICVLLPNVRQAPPPPSPSLGTGITQLLQSLVQLLGIDKANCAIKEEIKEERLQGNSSSSSNAKAARRGVSRSGGAGGGGRGLGEQPGQARMLPKRRAQIVKRFLLLLGRTVCRYQANAGVC
jgi:hypothetical protein